MKVKHNIQSVSILFISSTRKHSKVKHNNVEFFHSTTKLLELIALASYDTAVVVMVSGWPWVSQEMHMVW
jgi:hypothetical protein